MVVNFEMQAVPTIRRVCVLGGGSAGFLAAITIKHRNPELEVTVLRSKEIGIIGVGEATTLSLPQHLHGYLGMNLHLFYERAHPQWKLGIRFLWGKRPYFDFAFGRQYDTQFLALPRGTGYYCDEGPTDYVGMTSALMTHNAVFVRRPDGWPEVHGSLAYHLENETFVAFLEDHAERMGVGIHDCKVAEVLQNESGVTGLKLERGGVRDADLFVDCSGFVSMLLGKALQEPFISFRNSLFNDRSVVGFWNREEEPIQPYTTAESMNSGWCWQIDHEYRINRGYVYSSAFLSDGEAEDEFRQKNPKVGPTRIVKFQTGRYERAWVKNVVAMGNAGGFVEPLESTGLACICEHSQGLAEILNETAGRPTPTMIREFNKRHARGWDSIRDFLAIHFRFNERYDTPYWETCRRQADLCGARGLVEYFQENGPSVLWRTTLLEPSDQFGMEGYLSLLIGQQVPYHHRDPLTPVELATWERIRQTTRAKALQAFTVPQALAAIRSPIFQWPDRLYHEGIGANPLAR
jgi:tryptophan halogenase